MVTGSGNLNKTGAGTLALADSSGNTYTGDTNVLAGTLLVAADNALVPTGNLLISDGASVILDFNGNVGNDGIGTSTANCAGVGGPGDCDSGVGPDRHLDSARAGYAGAVTGGSTGRPGRMATTEPMNEKTEWRADPSARYGSA